MAQKRSQEALVKLNKATADWGRAKDQCKNLEIMSRSSESRKFEGKYKSNSRGGIELTFMPTQSGYNNKVEWKEGNKETISYSYIRRLNVIYIRMPLHDDRYEVKGDSLAQLPDMINKGSSLLVFQNQGK